ncbi:MAG: DUF2760 domain-containing protein [Bdellovibrionota bacterium]
MRLLFASFLLLVLELYDWLQRSQLRMPTSVSDTAAMQHVCLTLLALYLVLEGLFVVRNKSRDDGDESYFQHSTNETKQLLTQTEQKLSESTSAREELSRQVLQLSGESAELRTALKDAQTRLDQAQASQAAEDVSGSAVVSFLALLQQKGRFIDFIMDDIATYDDAQVGAAARVVHQGCSQLVREHFAILPVHGGNEGEKIELPQGFNVEKYRLLGRVVGEPPFRGVVLHRGWRAGRVSLPKTASVSGSADAREVIAPAEIELS